MPAPPHRTTSPHSDGGAAGGGAAHGSCRVGHPGAHLVRDLAAAGGVLLMAGASAAGLIAAREHSAAGACCCVVVPQWRVEDASRRPLPGHTSRVLLCVLPSSGFVPAPTQRCHLPQHAPATPTQTLRLSVCIHLSCCACSRRGQLLPDHQAAVGGGGACRERLRGGHGYRCACAGGGGGWRL